MDVELYIDAFHIFDYFTVDSNEFPVFSMLFIDMGG
ncbi:MAG: hypothetical protein BWY74_01906 [Firmicutes bacterium ADurb.Bin419]|nr:MAG: hypothetical protein BWY74_01906 [Firmicutes bacterium ADurb.Bin419]